MYGGCVSEETPLGGRVFIHDTTRIIVNRLTLRFIPEYAEINSLLIVVFSHESFGIRVIVPKY